jgi:predicted nucleotidyltransferase
LGAVKSGVEITADNVIATLREHSAELRNLGVTEIGLFGSVVRGEARADSDLDFIVELNTESFDAYLDVKDFLRSLFDREVHIGSLSDLRPEFEPFVVPELRYAEIS